MRLIKVSLIFISCFILVAYGSLDSQFTDVLKTKLKDPNFPVISMVLTNSKSVADHSFYCRVTKYEIA